MCFGIKASLKKRAQVLISGSGDCCLWNVRAPNAMRMEPPPGVLEMLPYLGIMGIFIKSDCSAGEEYTHTVLTWSLLLSMSSREL